MKITDITLKDVKNHIKDNREAYILGGSVVAAAVLVGFGVKGVQSASKAIDVAASSAGTITDITKTTFALHDIPTSYILSLKPEHAESYNRVINEIRKIPVETLTNSAGNLVELPMSIAKDIPVWAAICQDAVKHAAAQGIKITKEFDFAFLVPVVSL